MSLFHLSAKIIKRSQGASAVAAAAYRSAEKIYNQYDDVLYDYSRKSGVSYTEIMLPDNAPEKYKNRAVLWNAVEKVEKNKNSQLSRQIEVALQNEFSPEEQIRILKEYVRENFVNQGMCADIAVHNKGDGNPHAHIMLTMRSIDKNGQWMDKKKKDYILDKNGNKQYDPIKKTYKHKTININDWDNKENMEKWRESWAIINNREFERMGIDERIYHESYEKRGVFQIPTIHLGVQASALEKMSIDSDLGDINREIKKSNMAFNRELEAIEAEILELKSKVYHNIATSGSDMPQNGRSYDNLSEWSADELREAYIQEELAKFRYEITQNRLNYELRTVRGEIEDITERDGIIKQFGGHLEILREELKSSGAFEFDKKLKVNNQITQIDKSREQAIASLQREHEITPDEITDTLETLNKKIKKIEKEYSQLPDIDQIKSTQEMVLTEYKNRFLTGGIIDNQAANLDRNMADIPDREATKEELVEQRIRRIADYRLEQAIKQENDKEKSRSKGWNRSRGH